MISDILTTFQVQIPKVVGFTHDMIVRLLQNVLKVNVYVSLRHLSRKNQLSN